MRMLRNATFATVIRYVAASRTEGIKWILLALATVIILSLGPSLQFYLFSLLNTTKPSIYEAANGKGILHFPATHKFFFTSYNIPLIPISYLAVVFAIHSPRPSVFILRYSAVIAVGLTLYDMVSGVAQAGAAQLMQSVVSNGIGALALAFVVLGFLGLSNSAIDAVAADRKRGQIFRGIIVVLLSLLLAYSVIAAMRIFFDTLQTDVRVKAELPLGGMVLAKESNPKNPKPDDKLTVFSGFLPSSASKWAFDYTGQGGAFDWRNRNPSDRFEASVSWFADGPFKDLAKLPKPTFTKAFREVNRLAISMPGTVGTIKVYPDESLISRLKIESLTPTMFDLKSDTANISSTTFVGRENSFAADVSGAITITYEFTTIKGREASKTPTTIGLNLALPNFTLQRDVNGRSVRSEAKLRCRSINPSVDAEGVLSFTTVIRLRKVNDIFDLRAEEPQIQLTDASGWVEFENVSSKDYQDITFGSVSFIGINRAKGTAVLAEKAYTLDPDEGAIWLHGDFETRSDSKGAIRLSGSADEIWIGDKRYNFTMWETLPEDWAKWLLGGLLTLMGWIMLHLYRFIRLAEEKKELVWH